MENYVQQERSTIFAEMGLPPKFRENSATEVEAALYAAETNSYKEKNLREIFLKPKPDRRRLRELFVAFQNELYTFDTAPLNQCKQLASEMAGLESVLPRSYKNSNPQAEKEKRAACSLYHEALQAGILDEFIRSHPESETAFGRLADKAITLFNQSKLLKEDPVCRADFLVGCMLLVHRYFSRWITEESCQPSSLLVGFSSILASRFLASFNFDLTHKYFNLLNDSERIGIESHIKKINAANIKAYAVPTSLGQVKAELFRLNQLRILFPDLLTTQLLERRLPNLTQYLISCEPSSPQQLLDNRTLPFGTVALADAKSFVCYDGIEHTFSASLLGGEQPITTYYGGNVYHGKWITTQVHATASLDDKGKIFLKKDDRYRPAPEGETWQECREVLCAIDDECYKVLQKLWVDYPQIFGRISMAGPYLFIYEDSGQLILFYPDHGQSSDFTPQQTSEFLAKYHISFSTAAVGIRLSRKSDNVTESAVQIDNSPFSGLSRREELSFMRNQIGEKFTYEWLLKKLEPFGVKEDRERGKGSHWGLVRGEYYYTTSQNFRERPQFFRFLPEVLDALKIEYADFLARNGFA